MTTVSKTLDFDQFDCDSSAYIDLHIKFYDNHMHNITKCSHYIHMSRTLSTMTSPTQICYQHMHHRQSRSK